MSKAQAKASPSEIQAKTFSNINPPQLTPAAPGPGLLSSGYLGVLSVLP
jgi:hypothetical protein